MSILHLTSPPSRTIRGNINLDGSKSISNRALIALALAGARPADYLSRLSTSKDTVTLQRLLEQPLAQTFDAGDAGTTFRFLTAYLALQPGTQTLTGSHRMLERPIGALVDALRTLGADIQYLGNDGYPPLAIGEMNQQTASVRVRADVSSQFLSALALIGPYLPLGLRLEPDGPLVSKPYLDMTVGLMRHLGAEAQWDGDTLVVAPGTYTPKKFAVEADWSAASYHYALVALASDAELQLNGLFEKSWQGDAVLPQMMASLGVETTFNDDGIFLKKSEKAPKPMFEWDFLECPDIAQTLAVVCAGLGIHGLFTGLQTLSIKETDRIAALKTELKKVHVTFSKLPKHFSKKAPDKTFYMIDGQAHWEGLAQFATYGDHRMAMAFAPLALLGAVAIENPDVVDKSYGKFWEDLFECGIRNAECGI
ncbi:MAG: 3-phosphoshikimate 1-carboxyvinyltransferase [Saprospiraceae bacterium]|nr:3-phosphoshikimate 1-carboxyvinyltransferase [Saprospiraceae bacterium]